LTLSDGCGTGFTCRTLAVNIKITIRKYLPEAMRIMLTNCFGPAILARETLTEVLSEHFFFLYQSHMGWGLFQISSQNQ
jgi:hypothetical protein